MGLIPPRWSTRRTWFTRRQPSLWDWESGLPASVCPCSLVPLPSSSKFVFLRNLKGGAGKLYGRVQQNLAAGGQVLGRRALEFVVTDAVLAGHEDHGRGHNPGHIAGIVARSAHEIHVGDAIARGGLAHRRNAPVIEGSGRKVPNLLDLQLEAKVFRGGRHRLP